MARTEKFPVSRGELRCVPKSDFSAYIDCISFIQDSLPHVAEVNYSSTETVLEMESLPRKFDPM